MQNLESTGKISWKTKLRLFFTKAQYSADHYTDKEGRTFWTSTKYKVLNDVVYIIESNTIQVNGNALESEGAKLSDVLMDISGTGMERIKLGKFNQ